MIKGKRNDLQINFYCVEIIEEEKNPAPGVKIIPTEEKIEVPIIEEKEEEVIIEEIKQEKIENTLTEGDMITLLPVYDQEEEIIELTQMVSTTTRPTLRQGDSGQNVIDAQNYLYKLGYLKTTPTGNYGPLTVEAVKKLQQQNNLTVDGIIGANTWAILEPRSTNPTLRRGNRGDAVLRLQQGLQRLNYFDATPNGIFGPITDASVRQFQRDNNLTADGIVGPNTWGRLEERLSTIPPSHTGERPTLRLGDSGIAVAELQLKLQALGYYTGPLDNSFGPSTQSAVRNFQRDNNLTADGVVGPATWSSLDQAFAATNRPEGPNRPTIRRGSTGTNVVTLQQILRVLGYLNTEPTGNFLTQTENAVRNFQRAHGLSADGIVGPNTWSALYQAIAITPSVNYPVIKQGSSGNYVVILQTKLKELGYFAGSVTGAFGEITDQAVRDFQLNNNLVVDGVVGSTTWAKLFELTAVPPSSLPSQPRPVLRRGSSGEYVTLLQEELTTLLYYTGAINGIFGEQTELAVKMFQTINHLTPDGVVGKVTWDALRSLYPPKIEC